MVERHLQWYAHLPDCALVQRNADCFGRSQCLRSWDYILVSRHQLSVPLSAGLLHPAPCLQLQALLSRFGLCHLGLLLLFSHHHRCRPHLEGDDAGLHSADYRRPGVVLPGQVSVGRSRYGHFHRLPSGEQPLANDVLLPLRDGADGGLLRHRRTAPPTTAPLAESHPDGSSGRTARRGSQPAQHLPHL